MACLLVLACAFALLMTLALDTPIWMIVGFLFLLGCQGGLTNQIPVSALSQIKKEEEQEIANASTLLAVLRAAAAPLGVAIFASFVQNRSQYYLESLSRQGITGAVLQPQSILFAMHESFLSASVLALVAFAVMAFVPRRKKEPGSPASIPLREKSITQQKESMIK
jgi:MFS family permease